jgi:hypothetical protein
LNFRKKEKLKVPWKTSSMKMAFRRSAMTTTFSSMPKVGWAMGFARANKQQQQANGFRGHADIKSPAVQYQHVEALVYKPGDDPGKDPALIRKTEGYAEKQDTAHTPIKWPAEKTRLSSNLAWTGSAESAHQVVFISVCKKLNGNQHPYLHPDKFAPQVCILEVNDHPGNNKENNGPETFRATPG